ncbi:TadE family type IV pilus minor pilin [Spirillospora sp. CA-294931]|uniref:TadE family type IV pilus minor pilin n=1 Tax=Spirillospora sp. CA-294931 TaxID=3240042 RepID=UPI003D9084C9
MRIRREAFDQPQRGAVVAGAPGDHVGEFAGENDIAIEPTEPVECARGNGDPLRRHGGQRDRGMVTVEVALALPSLVLVTAVALWGVSIASVHLACLDAARSGARATARGEPLPEVKAFVERALPPEAEVQVRRDDTTSKVEITVPIRAPGPSGLPPYTIHVGAAAATEPITQAPTPGRPMPQDNRPAPEPPTRSKSHEP